MRVSEGHRLGALTFLIAAVAVYGASLFSQHTSPSQYSLPWGDRMAGTMAVEVSGSQGSDGIYFLPQNMSLGLIKKVIGVEDEPADPFSDAMRFDDRYAAAILLAGGVLNVGDMQAVTRLALGVPIDLNRASAEEIALVPGIGRNLAARIYQFRLSRGKIETLSELTAVPGIKEKKLNGLRQYLTPGPQSKFESDVMEGRQ